MQISRHWRLNPQRYRLQGVRYTNGDVRLVARALPCAEPQRDAVSKSTPERVPVPAGR